MNYNLRICLSYIFCRIYRRHRIRQTCRRASHRRSHSSCSHLSSAAHHRSTAHRSHKLVYFNIYGLVNFWICICELLDMLWTCRTLHWTSGCVWCYFWLVVIYILWYIMPVTFVVIYMWYVMPVIYMLWYEVLYMWKTKKRIYLVTLPCARD